MGPHGRGHDLLCLAACTRAASAVLAVPGGRASGLPAGGRAAAPRRLQRARVQPGPGVRGRPPKPRRPQASGWGRGAPAAALRFRP